MRDVYELWLGQKNLDEELRKELLKMENTEIEEAFYKPLSFGTGGMRGIIGAGTNRINRYTLGKAVYGFAQYLLNRYSEDENIWIAIAYDNRYKSDEFAKICAGILGASGIKSYLFEEMRPTPMLSYAVRHLKAQGGIMITASHNPPKYNGFKLYDEDGCQLVPDLADQVTHYVDGVENLFSIKSLSYNQLIKQNLVQVIGREIDQSYLEQIASVQLQPNLKKCIKIIFTPLHGACREVGLRALLENGYDVIPVDEQMVADPKFSTVKSPNPEDPSAFEYAIRYGILHQADLLIATDPDGDRLGIAVKVGNEYIFLNGNQTGAIFTDYILKIRKNLNSLPDKGIMYTTIVTSDFGGQIAKTYGYLVHQTLTGFKFIGEQMKKLETTNTEFLIGYEESYGYVIKDFVRDKDAVQAMVLAAEIANYLKHDQKTMLDYLEELYHSYGAYREDLVNLVLEGQSGEIRFKNIMGYFREWLPESINNLKVVTKEDYYLGLSYINGHQEKLDYPQSDVIKYILENGAWFVLRPSGTEPKLKIYFSYKDTSTLKADASIAKLKETLMSIIETIK